MVLQNADGSEAEMSGNGMRCLAQAAVQSALVMPPTFTVATLAGIKTVAYAQAADPDTAWATVGMGPAASARTSRRSSSTDRSAPSTWATPTW